MKKYVLIVAGGKGLRMGGELPKQFIPFQGKPVLMHTIEAFYQWDSTVEIILVLPVSHQSYWNMLCEELPFSIPHRIANGGETRFHSVRNGLEYVTEPGLVAVHDGVRPFVNSQVIKDCFKEASVKGAAIPVIPIIDSIRKKEKGRSFPVDRDKYCCVQTPQVFTTAILKEAYLQSYSSAFTDDASVVEAMGEEIFLTKGNRENIKITTPFDLLIAEAWFAGKEKKG
ncbi:MAG: 2-C-methyl-D-erythritol 4-phosphate cytidylyltransferase [Tannerellaceae bacterium]|nr:2-C-methyl-D-erythritol 4-phosphate cytidylyltransferase [Tannerellaceae bacterium]